MTVGGKNGGCKPVRIYDVKPTQFVPRCVPYCADYFYNWRFYLPVFSGVTPAAATINSPGSFTGCGGNTVGELDRIEFRNDNNWVGDVWLCMDNLMLV